MILAQALSNAQAVMATATRDRGLGCCRVYVCLMGLDQKTRKEAATFAKAHGMIFQKKAYYGLTDAIYIGYDNCDGIAHGRGKAFAGYLEATGLRCYVELCGD